MNEHGILSRYVEAGMSELRRSFLSLTGTIGLVAAALPPALMFTFAVTHALEPGIGSVKAWAVGVSLGIALESAGVKISHVALDYFRQWRDGDGEAQPLFLLSTLFTVFYLASGAIAIYYFDEDPTIRLAGWLSYLVAAIMYVASGLELLKDIRINGVVAKLQSMLDAAVAARDKALAELDKLVAEHDKATEKLSKVTAERDKATVELATVQAERDKLQKKLDEATVQLDKLPTKLAAYVTEVANGVTPNGPFSDKYDVGATSLDRANRMFLKE